MTPTDDAMSDAGAWSGTATIARSGAITLGALWLVLVGVVVFSWVLSGPSSAAWLSAVILVLMSLAIASSLVFRVRVTAAGLQVRSAIGWPHTRIPLRDITRVETVRVDPFAEFGGWGWRLGLDGRRGVVLRRGDALQVTRTGGKVFVVTVDAATEAAAVLASLRQASTDA
jgi:hypothetical protein